jgi:hypothetical protein
MRIQIAIFLLIFYINKVSCQHQVTPDFKEVMPIFSSKCGRCHNASISAPFNLLSYKNIVSKAPMIKKVIAENIMPPVIIDTAFRMFDNVISLTADERKLIVSWIDGGMKNEANVKVKSESIKRSFYKPNFEINFDDKLVLGGVNRDQYFFQLTDIKLKDTAFISRYDYVIKNKHLHHAEVLDIHNHDSLPSTFNSLTSDYVLNDKRISINRYLLGWFPGSTGGVFPKQTGIKIFPDKRYQKILHYSPTLEKHIDKSYIALKLTSKRDNTIREIFEYALYGTRRYIQENRGLPFLKAEEIKEFYYVDTLNTDLSAFAIYFHAHHLCRNMKAFAITPLQDTINLLKIDDWNFNWQFTYRLDKYLKIPKGSAIHCKAVYDNTSSNIHNPNIPSKDVMASFFSEDEMLEFFILYLNYIEGDENKKIEYYE